MKLIYFVFLLVIISSCKKGEDDPFLSLRSRNKRLIGEWILVKEESVYNNGDAYYFDGTNFSVYDQGQLVDQYPYSEQMTINKDGRLKMNIVSDGTVKSSEESWSWFDGGKKKTVLRFVGDDYFKVIRLTNKEMVLEFDQQEPLTNGDYTYSDKLTYKKK